MKKLIISFLLLTAALSIDAKPIKGTVKDTEGNGLAGVVVSDGLNAVQTDAKGRYSLDTDSESRFVFVSTPAGYKSAVLEGETLYYKKLGLAKKYDFIVQKKSKDDTNHNLIVIADPQISDADEFPELEVHSKDIGEFVKTLDGDDVFGLCLGDIVGWNHALYPQYNKVMSHTGIEFRNVMGNHDMTNYGDRHEGSMKDYEDAFGPAWYSFNAGKVHYVVLNDNFFIGRDWYYIGYLDKRQLEWLEKDLSFVPEGSTVIVSLHIPTTLSEEDRKAFSYSDISEIMANKQGLYNLLKPYKSLILSGHMHTGNNQIISDDLMEHNVTGLCGAWWCGPVCCDGAPVGYKIYEIDGDDIRWQYKPSGLPLSHQFKIYVDADQHEGYVVANVWDYDPQWKVEYFEDGVKVCDMDRFKGQDPFAIECYKDPSTLKRSWVWALPTENLFRAKHSAEAKVLEVRVTDRFGRTFIETVTR